MNNFNLSGKVIIVTGGSKGLGRAMALGLGEAGARVVVVSRTRKLIEEVADKIINKGGDAIAIPADIKDEQDIKKLVKLTYDKYERIDVLINNAGIAPMNKTVNVSLEEWNNVMDTNLRSIFLTTKAVGEKMIVQKNGKVINISSVLGKMASNVAPHYCTSKAGVMQLTKALALEWARYNINVNCIAPGFFATEMTNVQQKDENHKQFLLSKIPFRRLGRPEEIVGAAIFLSSDASNYITGATLFIDGGYSIW